MGSGNMTAPTAENDPKPASPSPAPAPPPPPTHRRPRVREVRSRFMSTPTSSADLPKHEARSTSAQRQRMLEPEPLSRADENSSVDSPSAKPTPVASFYRRQPLPRSLKENGDPEALPRISTRTLRPDTPTVSTSIDHRIGSSSTSRSRLTPLHYQHGLQRSISAGGATAAAKLLHANGMSMSFSGPSAKARSDGSSCHDSDSDTEGNHKSVQELRSSMPEADMANRLLERNGNRVGRDNNSRATSASSPCSRPLNSPRSSCEHPMRPSERVVNSLFKQQQIPTPLNAGKVPLPPVAPSVKPGAEAKKGRKVSSHQEDVHALRLLHNHYLQWRFTNAKAEVSMQTQRTEAERLLYSSSLKMADMYESVKRKRAELAILQRIKNISEILEPQMPYLEEWSALEENYLTSLSETIQALLNASFQLPVGANVRADVQQMNEALASALKIMEGIVLHVQSHAPKAEELELLISELARVAGGERILVEECGELLQKTYVAQVKECSLRGQRIQIQSVQHAEQNAISHVCTL